ncbi:MAG: LPS assembly protein LptD [Methylococcales bacterium]|nr:LPS assembly protein LptD [Methylococcales bacterium]
MFLRLFVVVCLWVYSVAALSQGATAGWSCQQKKGSQEWLCVTDKDTASGSVTEVNPRSPAITELVPATVTRIPKVSPEFTPVELPPGSIAKRPGWTCLSGEADESWDCSLMGRDPQGEGRVIVDEDFKSSILPPAFAVAQEDIFKMMQGDLKFDPWENCERLPINRQDFDFAVDESLRLSSPLVIEGDSAESFDNEVTTFVGNVEMVRADQRTLSDKASLDKVSSTIDAQGNVYYRADDISFYSDTSFMKLATDESRLRTALFISPGSRTRGTADVVYRENEFLTRYKNVAYTTCKPGNQDWVLHAKRAKLNDKTGKGAVKEAWLEFKGVPVIYTPYFSFPLDDRRVSGFLNAAWDNTEKNGLDFTVPYYWNIAPNYDAVLRPRYMSERGLMLAGDFRYLSASSKGKFSGEFLISDNKATALDEVTVNPHKGQQRGNFKWQNQSKWEPDLIVGDSLEFDVDVNYLSDDDYYDELSNSFTVTQNAQMRSFSTMSYSVPESEGTLGSVAMPSVNLTAMVEHYLTIDNTISDADKPYRRLPQINLSLRKLLNFEDFDFVSVDLNAENEFVYFQKETGVIGSRVNLKPSIALPLQLAGFNVTPKVTVQHTAYQLENQDDNTLTTYSRTLPIYEIAGNFILQREFSDVLGLNLRHTIEPRASYFYIPQHEDNSHQQFDSASYDPNSAQMYRALLQSGPDSVAAANRVVYGVSTALIDSGLGLNYAQLNVDQQYDFLESNFSNIIVGLKGELTKNLRYSSELHWIPDLDVSPDPRTGSQRRIDRFNASLEYMDENVSLVNLGYRYRRNGLIQSDLSFAWPLFDDWNLVGRWVYSLKENMSLEMFSGLEKDNCCWRFRVLARRYANSTSQVSEDQEQYDMGLFVQLELKGLTALGDKVGNFLNENLPGYEDQRTNNQ